MRDPLRASDTAQYNNNSSNTGYDGNYSNSGGYQEDDISKKSDGSPYDGANLEKVESERRGSAVFRAAMNEDSSYKTLNRWQASLIYITNQVGIGILSLPSAMQTLGLIPCIITIVGMGKQ